MQIHGGFGSSTAFGDGDGPLGGLLQGQGRQLFAGMQPWRSVRRKCFYGHPSPPYSCCPGERLHGNDGDPAEGALL